MDSVITPLALIDYTIFELLIASSLAIMVVPFADVIRPVWLYLTTISMHFIFFELSFIEETEAVKLCTLAMSSSC